MRYKTFIAKAITMGMVLNSLSILVDIDKQIISENDKEVIYNSIDELKKVL